MDGSRGSRTPVGLWSDPEEGGGEGRNRDPVGPKVGVEAE